MEHMTPKRLHVMLDTHAKAHEHVGKQSDITGLVYSDSITLMNGRTTFCVCMVPLVYEGPVWWHVDIGTVAVDIEAKLPHEPRNIQSIHAEIKRVLRILAPKLSVGEVNRLRATGWLHTIG